MAKERKTSRELEQMIKERAPSLGDVHVFSDPVLLGWHVTVVSARSKADEHQKIAERIAAELRPKYDLKT